MKGSKSFMLNMVLINIFFSHAERLHPVLWQHTLGRVFFKYCFKLHLSPLHITYSFAHFDSYSKPMKVGLPVVSSMRKY